MEMQLPDDFKEFLRLLNANEVEYLLIGGFAGGDYGYPRTTNDIDVWGARTELNSKRVVTALEEFGFGIPELEPKLFLKPDCIVRMGVPPKRVEILTGISGVEFESCYQARIEGRLNGVSVDLIGLEDLKRNKQASCRHKDVDDLEHLP